MAPDIAILCHFDRAGRLRPDTLRYLRELREAGFWIVVVSNGTPLGPEAIAALTGIADVTLTRWNLGMDFGAWRMAMRVLNLPRPHTRRLLLINDSVFGPLVPLAPLLARLGTARLGTDDTALWGLTDSKELGWHLQSYFLLANAPLIHAPVWRRFWRYALPLPFRRWTVRCYELGLSRRVTRAGFTAQALFPYATIMAEERIANPTLEAWRALLEAGFPFLKRELLRDNPTGEPGLAAWRGLVAPDYVAEIDAALTD